MDFSQLKSLSGKKSLDVLNAELSKIISESVPKGVDDRFWTATVDKAGNGYAVIRFLPAPKDEDIPFIRIFDHGFQGPTGLWYIEKSLTTLGKPDPVSEYNTKLWNSNSSDDSAERKKVRKQKRRLHYISNIYVVQDSATPENEGKVFLYSYGKKIFDKLNEAMNPQFADELPMNPFDLWSGANFKLKIRNVEGYRNYDKSEFDKPAPLLENDDKLKAIWEKEYSLKEFHNPSNFKSYDELKSRLIRVLDTEEVHITSKPIPSAEPVQQKAVSAKKELEVPSSDLVDDDDSIEFFKSLAN